MRRAGFAFRMHFSRFLLRSVPPLTSALPPLHLLPTSSISYSIFSCLPSRYKLICNATWPTYRGSDKDGTATIIDDQGFSDDVQYGKTKVFIRHPQTIFTLEQQRTNKLPAITLLLQRVRFIYVLSQSDRILSRCGGEQWQGSGRNKCEPSTKSWMLIENTSSENSFTVCTRAMGTVFANQLFDHSINHFSNARNMRGFGKSVRWPPCPRGLEDVSHTFQRAHARLEIPVDFSFLLFLFYVGGVHT